MLRLGLFATLTALASAFDLPRPGTVTSRRHLLETAAGTTASMAAAALTIGPCPARAEFIGGPPMIREWPGLQYLVPLYEMGSSLALLESQLDPSKGAEGVALASALVERFFRGGLVSNRNIYKGLCLIYTQEIQYDDPDRRRVRDHRAAFLDDCDMTINSLEAIRKPLKKLADGGADTATTEVMSSLRDAKEGVQRFLSRTPPGEVDRIRAWFKAVDSADVDRNGKVEGGELSALSDDDIKVYKAVSDLLG